MGLDIKPYLREIVSGKKARFIDHDTATNLDLVYVTDRILMCVRYLPLRDILLIGSLEWVGQRLGSPATIVTAERTSCTLSTVVTETR